MVNQRRQELVTQRFDKVKADAKIHGRRGRARQGRAAEPAAGRDGRPRGHRALIDFGPVRFGRIRARMLRWPSAREVNSRASLMTTPCCLALRVRLCRGVSWRCMPFLAALPASSSVVESWWSSPPPPQRSFGAVLVPLRRFPFDDARGRRIPRQELEGSRTRPTGCGRPSIRRARRRSETARSAPPIPASTRRR